MTNQPYVVIRVVPESPIDGATFSTYLNDLALQVLDANTLEPLSKEAYASPLSVFGWPPGSGGYLSVTSVATAMDTPYDSTNNMYGSTLKFASTDGISVGSYVYSADRTTIPLNGVTVTAVTADSVTLGAPLSTYVPAETVVTFLGRPAQYGGGAVSTVPGFSFTLTAKSDATGSGSELIVLHFADTVGVMIGMGASGPSIPDGTIVTAVTPTTVTISNAVTGAVGAVTFTLEPPFVSVTRTPLSGAPKAHPTTLTFTAGDTDGVPVGAMLTPVAGLIEPGTTVTGATTTTLTLSTPLDAPLPKNQAVTFAFMLSLDIAQHTEVVAISGWEFFGGSVAVVPAAVATAILPLTKTPLPGYLDIKIKATRGAETVPVTATYHNVNVFTDEIPSTDRYQQIPATDTGLYLVLPPTPRPNTIPLTIPADGSAPPFDKLYAAMGTALQNDPITDAGGRQVSPADLINSSASCSRVAYDIVWSYQNALPPLPDPLESLYTNPPNPGGGGDAGSGSNNFEQDRQKFEGALNSFYSTRNATAERLTKFVAAASAAAACERMSITATSALLEFPVDSSVPFVAAVDSEVLLQGVNGVSGLNFGVPAAYFYALGVALDKSTTAAQRFQLATGDAIERVLQQFAAARDKSVIGDSEGFSAAGLVGSITAFQAARRLGALAVSRASSTPVIPVLAGSPLAGLVGTWLGATDPSQDSLASYPNDDFTIWSQQLAPANARGCLDLDLDALTRGYVIAPFTASPSEGSGSTLTFAAGAGIGSGMPVTGVGIAAGTVVQQVTVDAAAVPPMTTVTLSLPVTGEISSSTVLTFNAVAPLVTEATTADCESGTVLALGGTSGIVVGMTVLGAGIAAGTAVQVVTAGSVTLSAAVVADVPTGTPVTFASGSSTLADQIASWLSSSTSGPTVETLKQVTAAQWTNFFTASPQWLPPFTQPVLPGAFASGASVHAGYVATRIRAFVRAVQQFFTVSTAVAGTAELPPADAPSTFELPVYDPIGLAVKDLGLQFGDALTGMDLAAEAHIVFPGDPAAQAWLVEALTTINELWQIAGAAPNPVTTGTLPYPVGVAFSIAEALYARGFRRAADIAAVAEAEFGRSLIGTVAYEVYGVLWAKARDMAPVAVAPVEAGAGFASINPDGALVDCVPPPSLSPTGAIAYLQEMLTVSELSSCDVVAGTGVTLGAVLAQRRGPVGQLAASRANLELSLPLVDLVNECLEYLGSAAAAGGTVYDSTEDGSGDDRHRDAARLLVMAPQHSTPGLPDAVTGQPAVYQTLKADFSSCLLPYSQALDVGRTYLRELGSSRFEQMRTFRRCITEFVLDPVGEPAGFGAGLWRYPVRIDTAIEYLGIAPEEYTTLFGGVAAPPCGAVSNNGAESPTTAHAAAAVPAAAVQAAPVRQSAALGGTIGLSEFLADTCLSYCEFYELWQSGYVSFDNGATGSNGTGDQARDGGEGGAFAPCEPGCLDGLCLVFPQQQDQDRLRLFARLWRMLCEAGRGYCFAELRDVCDVLRMWVDGAPNPEFIRQLAAFAMLRGDFGMELADPRTPVASGAVDADRTHLLALWVGPSAAQWPWAVRTLIARVERYAQRRHGCEPRSAMFVKLLTGNLDPLSRLAGFDPDSATDSWHALPTHTLRFAEVLAKIYASRFSVGELIYLFTAEPHLDGDDPFPLQARNDALDDPFGLPEDEPGHALWRLRRELLEVDATETEDKDEEDVGDERRMWRRIEATLHTEFGFAPADIAALGGHFFPRLMARVGARPADPAAACFVSALAAADTSAPMWNNPADGPLHYDPSVGQLSCGVPLTDRAVLAKLTGVRELNAAERRAVQDLYFQPRALLARFALLFADFAAAQGILIEEHDEECRFEHFRREVVGCRRRTRRIVDHLERQVTAVTGHEAPDDGAAALILRTLSADGNIARGSWEDDSGAPPDLTWTRPAGSALAALLDLTGTGMTVEYRPQGAGVVWRDVCDGLGGFGRERNRLNCPVPTVLPALNTALEPPDLRYVSVHNGLLMKDATDAYLGGAQGFTATWQGALLIEREGAYEFSAEVRAQDRSGQCHRWRVVLRRGQRTWVILSHGGDGEDEIPEASLPLKRGVYELTAELVRPAPHFHNDDEVRAQHTGFEVRYCGPDTGGERIEIPHRALFVVRKDHTLADGIDVECLGEGAAAYLNGLYFGSLRDIRRTYQRAFKALLLCRRLGLSARRQPHGTSELGYLLAQAPLFAGSGYYRAEGGFARHAADLDLDFLPVRDGFHAPAAAVDARTAPSPQRVAAMFDWWERLFDYTVARAEVRERTGHALWQLFEEARDKRPAHPGYLLRYMGADSRHWSLDLHYFQGQDASVYAVDGAELSDERWTLRAWHADRWLRAMQHRFAVRDIEAARPDLWAADDPAVPLPGESLAGNANLVAFVTEGCLEGGAAPRYDDLRRVNDGLRERGRRALIAYLCRNDRVALPSGGFATAAHDLSDLLVLDVEAGLHQQASRIEEAITAAQTFVRRCRLGLEPGWTIGREFARLWESRFESYRTWQRARARELYRENWIEWEEVGQARRIEAFQFLESQLPAATLTMAVPGGVDWWPDDDTDLERAPEVLQRRVPSTLQALSPAREGLTALGRPEYADEPTWLAAVPPARIEVSNSIVSNSNSIPGGNGSPADRPAPGEPAAPGRTGAVAGPGADGASLQPLPLWMESAMNLGTRFVRVAAADVPQAAMTFVPRGERTNGHPHPAGVDEYYFWLVNTQVYTEDLDTSSTGDAGNYQFGFQNFYYDQVQQQSAEWDDEARVPSLLAKWQPSAATRLAWCRVHHGEFGQPRRSAGYVLLDREPDLTFLGRAGDSLHFAVTGAAPLPPGYGGDGTDADDSPPGFRYDLPSDDAVALPLALKPPAPTPPESGSYPGGLPSYPFFAYDEPGAPLFPGSWFATSMAVAGGLRTHHGYELALRWYRRAFDPLGQDCAWMHCPSIDPPTTATESAHPPAAAPDAVGNGRTPARPGACCDATQVTTLGARHRAVTMNYCRTVVEWGDELMRRGHSPEAFAQARVLYDTAARITGPRPRTIALPEPVAAATVAAFVPAYPPLNPHLMDLYEVIEDRVGLIHRSLDSQRLRNGRPRRDMPYFGNHAGVEQDWDECADDDRRDRPSPYRFVSQISKAVELAGRVRELGAELLSAYEKGDGEYLASIRAEQEREMAVLGIAVRQDQWRDADWQVQALQQTKDLNQANLLYYFNLYRGGLINNELQDLSLTNNALQTRTGANMAEVEGEIMALIPDSYVGAMSTFVQVPIGTKLGGLFHAIAEAMRTIADIQGTTAALDATQAAWQRRAAEWLHEVQTLPIEIEQIEAQILGAHRRRDQALAELNNQQRQTEHATEVLEFLRDKFTATELYLWLQRDTAALHRQMYELARRAAREAERAFNFELGHTRRRFVPEDPWDSLHAGLMAGERLDAAMRQMEKAYLDENRRELELTKHISLRRDLPGAYLALRTTGYCEISIPEWMFDLDYPGHYLRRIKNVTLTLPCVTGPYTGVHCRLTLLSSATRTSPQVRPPAQHCCPDGPHRGEYEACAQDPRVVHDYAARESIATSSGQNDSGLFELSFRDERYLPFEYLGAVSRWRIEVPPENNYFDLNTVTDLVLNLDYTARDGGRALREAAGQQARGRLPGDGTRLFDVRHDFPDAWPALREPDRREHGRRLRLGLTPRMFGFIPGRRVHSIGTLLLMFAAPDAVPGRHHLVRFWRDEPDCGEVTELVCVASEEWPGFYCGTIDLGAEPLELVRDDRPAVCVFEFPGDAGEISNAFVVVHYDAQPWPTAHASEQPVHRFARQEG